MNCTVCNGKMELEEQATFGCHDYYQYVCDCGHIEHRKELREDATDTQKRIWRG